MLNTSELSSEASHVTINIEALSTLREILGRRRYRVAVFYFGRKLRQRDIARRLRISQQMVSKDVIALERQFPVLRRAPQKRQRYPLLHAVAEPSLN